MKPQNRKEPIGCLIALLIIVGSVIGAWQYSERQTEAMKVAEEQKKAEAQAQAEAAQLQRQEILTAFAARSNAVIEEWRNNEADSTADFQEHMVRADGRPIVFVAHLEDIIKSVDSYLLFFSPFLVHYWLDLPSITRLKHIYYWITCDIPQGDRLREQILRKKYRDKIAVAALLSSVERPWFPLYGESPRMALRARANAIIAYGRLVDWMTFELPTDVPSPPAPAIRQRVVPEPMIPGIPSGWRLAPDGR